MNRSHQGFSGGDPAILPVALVLPVKNEARALPELFDALARAPAWPAEIAFVDAGSSDGTVAAIHAWWQTQASVRTGVALRLLEQPGAFPGGGRNAGIAATQAEWVALMDGGIRPEPDWLAALHASAVAGGRDHAFGLCRFDAKGAMALAVCALTNGVGRTATVLPASIFHRRVFEQIGLFPAHLRSAEDLVWLKKFDAVYGVSGAAAGTAGTRHICPEALVHYTHYPATFRAIFCKWRDFERSSVAAGTGNLGRALYLCGTVLMAVLVLLAPMAATGVLIAYLLLRGVIDPVRRSRQFTWWRKAPGALALAPVCALTMDAGRLAGALWGLTAPGSRPAARRV